MDQGKELVERLLAAYQALDHKAMADCYHERAEFSDIAFRLNRRKQIHAMWNMICDNGIDVQVESIATEGAVVRTLIVDSYTFSDTDRPVVNRIHSSFEFRDALIASQRDTCDPLGWARQAFGGWKGEVAGRIGLIRRMAANKKLRNYIAAHPQYD